jgi:hypothetical protein
LFPEIVSDSELAENSNLTPKGLTEMKQRLPYANLGGFEANPEVDELLGLYTVDMLVQYASSKLSAGGLERLRRTARGASGGMKSRPQSHERPGSARQAPRPGRRPHTHMRRRTANAMDPDQ